ncbi:MAG: AraC family transcriptional regulator [Rhodoferax sp.]|nr:AraC family transcriptional regulator [Rhodoferax sp.]MDP3650168.1 AraC family transcriptional regulator [Rhodoferax sp.]
MDLLTDIFRQAGLRRRLLDQRHLLDATALQFPCDRSMGVHVVTAGQVYLHSTSLPEPLRLQAGDMAIMARGCVHTISTHEDLGAVRTVALDHAGPLSEPGAPDDAPQNALISGAYQFWHTPVHPFFAEMPDWLVLRAQDGPYPDAMAHSMELLQQELTLREQGSETLVYGLLDVIFVLLMREMLQRQGERTSCWSHGIRDPQVMKAVQALHNDCARAWTLDTLAQHAGLSRTSLAERFRESMGNTPLNYLRTVRMQKAMAALSESERSLEQIAREVGYTDAFSFSKVFKRTVGLAPRDFRRQDTQDKSLAWRIA